MNEEELLRKLSEANGATLVLGFKTDSEAAQAEQSARQLEKSRKVDLHELRVTDDHALEIKATVF
ncbi:hypothetical protein NCCP2716_01060 [Sporosarcina sp. NCCP-2716]|uniref:hypothetical protein n=1 Tax=Sporosarcina sp. NCCP-2716 TaxID=2943679 RepID=UPI00203D81A5|nr:hypothetical protein [Sporosarcina sp. NCCP-2716]GKV67608.1 hypothetical protein NCCP2716_01060 [Sporosarcina sp. NCCP-2716]